MPDEFPPTGEQLRRYYRRELSPDELIALSDYFARHPEQRRFKFEPATERRLDVISPTLPEGWEQVAGYSDLVAKLEGAVADPAERNALEARIARDPLSATYLADLAAFKQKMAALPECTHGPDLGRSGSEALLNDDAHPPPSPCLERLRLTNHTVDARYGGTEFSIAP